MCLWNACGRYSYHLYPVFIFFLVRQVLSHLFHLMRCNLVSPAQVHGEAAGGQAAGVSVSAAVHQERWSAHGGPRWRIGVGRRGCAGRGKTKQNTHLLKKKKKNLPQVFVSCVSCRGRRWVPWWVRWPTGRGSLRTWTAWWGGSSPRFTRRWRSCCSWWMPTPAPSTATWWETSPFSAPLSWWTAITVHVFILVRGALTI